MARVSAGGRLHFGFCNLSLSHERLYGALGVALAEPRVTVTATPADEVHVSIATDDTNADGLEGGTVSSWTPGDDTVDALRADVRSYATVAADRLGVPGVSVTIESSLPRHAGLGSGTQLAATTLAAVARAYDRQP
ncbi:GHMP kinase, partial [Halorubrum tibetense]